MRERVFSSSKLVRHPPEKLFQVVADVARYEEFVPFCASSRVLRVLTPTRFEAELEIGFKVFSERYVSDVTLEEDPATGEKKVTATAIPPREDDDGLFQRLVSTWRFKPGRAPDETAVAFDLDFKVNSVVHSQVVALAFEEVSRLQIGAFERRCDELFGRRAAAKASAEVRERGSAGRIPSKVRGDEDVEARVLDATSAKKNGTFDPATRARVLAAFARGRGPDPAGRRGRRQPAPRSGPARPAAYASWRRRAVRPGGRGPPVCARRCRGAGRRRNRPRRRRGRGASGGRGTGVDDRRRPRG